MTELNRNNPVVAAAHARVKGPQELTTAAGVRVLVQRVSPSLIADVQRRIRDPQVPMWHNPDKSRDEPNPNDPAYLAELQQARLDRGAAALDAIIMFGVKLLDGLPTDTSWLRQLAMIGIAVDETDDLAVEFAYKKYIALNSDDLQALSNAAAGINPQEVATAEAVF